jgi:XTP/dITP diphosphohydrolase
VKARLASQNVHKLEELQAALPDWELELLGPAEFPPEDGETYYENARLKAAFGRTLAGPDAWSMADDSGIELAALDGGPGVHSARWTDDHLRRVLEEVGRADDRRARYVCELVALSPDGAELRGTGILEGSIASEPRGIEGFGYDPIFVPDGETQTVAELGNAWKRTHSHRARAATALRHAVGT